MFGNAWVVDIISDGQQLFDSGIVGADAARDIFNERTANTVAAAKEAGATGREYTVRAICNGDVRAEITVGDNGVILDGFNRL